MKNVYPSQEELTRAKNVMRILFENDFYHALCYYHQPEVDEKFYALGLTEWLDLHSDLLSSMNIVICSGETKVCIIDEENENWVLKVGFDRTTDPYYTSNGIAIDFCEREIEFYAKACDNNLQDCFAATYQLGKIRNVCVSIQEAVRVDEDLFFELFEDYAGQQFDREDFETEDGYYAAVSDSTYDMDNDDRIYAVLGEDSDNLVNFIDMMDINDLHAGNWGVTNDGKYVIMDFSGFID